MEGGGIKKGRMRGSGRDRVIRAGLIRHGAGEVDDKDVGHG